MRYTEYHCGKAVIKDRELLPEAMAKLARFEDEEETGMSKNNPFPDEETFERIYSECLENRAPATAEQKEMAARRTEKLHRQFTEYIAELQEDAFRYGYECGWDARLKEESNAGI